MAETHTVFDTDRRFVRIIEQRVDGFVEFGFAVGEPDLEVELLMSTEAFDEFCRLNAVTLLDAGTPGAAWGLHDARSGRIPTDPETSPPSPDRDGGSGEPTGGATP